MPRAVTFGLALALACALATSISFLLKQRGAVSAPPVRVRHPLRSAADLFRSRWFAVGWLVAVGAWALHVGALALAPLSVVQAVLSAGWSSSPCSPSGTSVFTSVAGSGSAWSSRRQGLRSSGSPKGHSPPTLRATHWPP